MVEKIFMKYLDVLGVWIEERYCRLFLNCLCGFYFCNFKLYYYIVYFDE